MEMNEFAGKVRDAVEKKLGEAYKVEVRKVQKNNGVMLHGLLILNDDRNVIPTLYLEPFWEAYVSGVTLAEIVRRLTGKICQRQRSISDFSGILTRFRREYATA